MQASSSGLTIGALAQRTGVRRSAIRFYEREGLLQEPGRLANGYRVFSTSAVDQVRFIKVCQGLGMDLADVRGLLSGGRGEGLPCAAILEVLHERARGLSEQIKDLQSQRRRVRLQIKKAQASKCAVGAAFPSFVDRLPRA